MSDPRIESYAKLLVEGCIDVQPGWQVVVSSQPAAEPLIVEVMRAIARRGAYAIPRISLTKAAIAYALEASDELLGTAPPIVTSELESLDAYIAIQAPDNTREETAVGPEKTNLMRAARMPFLKRVMSDTVTWVGCQYPTPALAQDAGMSTGAFEDFLYGACLIDWSELEGVMRKRADRFDAAEEVHITGPDTDIRLSIDGRPAKVDALSANMPGGEFFFSPVDGTTEGVISYSEFPACYGGRVVEGVRLRFENGRVIDASSRTEEDFLIKTLDTDEGARNLGELGIGCNPGITRHMRNTLFDEKMDGTIHMAVGAAFPFIGGTNQSVVHWDMVKDLRTTGSISLDGEVVQRDGAWLI